MIKRTKKLSATAAIGSFCWLLAAGEAAAEEERPTANLSVGAYSKYVWRGFELSDDSLVIQPSMTVGYKGASFNLWGNLDTDYYGTEPTTSDFNETDLTMSYGWQTGPVKFSAGYIYYALEGDDSQEFFLSAGLATLLNPKLTVYRDTDEFPGWYATFELLHSIPLAEKINLDLGAKVSYMKVDDEDTIADPRDHSKEYSDFHDGVLSAAVIIPINEYFSITPGLYYSFPLGSDAKDVLEEASVDGDDSSFVYGGVSVSLAF